jgi:hypothetical protein
MIYFEGFNKKIFVLYIQLNPNRYQKRRAPYPFENLNTPFDNNKFNFNKIKDEEVRWRNLFCLLILYQFLGSFFFR